MTGSAKSAERLRGAAGERAALPWRFLSADFTLPRQTVYKLNLVPEEREGFIGETSRGRTGTNEGNQRPMPVFPRRRSLYGILRAIYKGKDKSFCPRFREFTVPLSSCSPHQTTPNFWAKQKKGEIVSFPRELKWKKVINVSFSGSVYFHSSSGLFSL